MLRLEVAVHEVNADEIKNLRPGVQVLCYNSLYSKFELLKVGEDSFPRKAYCWYFLLDEPENCLLPAKLQKND